MNATGIWVISTGKQLFFNTFSAGKVEKFPTVFCQREISHSILPEENWFPTQTVPGQLLSPAQQLLFSFSIEFGQKLNT